MRSIMDDSHIVLDFPRSHTSQTVDLTKLELRQSDIGIKEILEKEVMEGRMLSRKKLCSLSCRKRHNFTKLSFFDFREHTRAEKIGRILSSSSLEELSDGLNYCFDEVQLQLMTHGLLKMCVWAKLDIMDITALRDLINY